MFTQFRKIRRYIIIALAVIIIVEVLLLVLGGGRTSPMQTGLMLVAGLLIGGLLTTVIWMAIGRRNNKQIVTRESSHTVVESVKKVFKIVLVEGQFSDIYSYEETQKMLGLIPSTKKALVMNKSKVMIGFDFNKCVWEVDEEGQTLNIIEFPEPEILSMDTDLKYYNMENGLFNKFDADDYAAIQDNVKKQIKQAVHASDLPQLARDQISILLQEVVDSKHWLLRSQSSGLLLE